MERKIFSIGFSFPGDDHSIEEIKFTDHRSLADADIVIFNPRIASSPYYSMLNTTHQDLPCLNADPAAKLNRDCDYWRQELQNFVESGKTVFVILDKPFECFCATGDKTFDGKGKNARSTIHVKSFHSYSTLPTNLTTRTTKGKELVYTGPSDSLRSIFAFLKPYFTYQIIFQSNEFPGVPFFKQKNNTDIAGGILQFKNGGSIVLMPFFDIEENDKFIEEKGDEWFWTEEAEIFSKSFVTEIVRAEKAIRSDVSKSSPPAWTASENYSLKIELEKIEKLSKVEKQIQSLQKNSNDLLEEIQGFQQTKALLYAKGKELEIEVRSALELMGFKVDHYDDGKSEFDVLFSSKEGSFLGEVEGKDDSAIDVKKLSQLMRKQAEFLEIKSENIEGVFFGNGFRLKPPSERLEQFTEKCISFATTKKFALVRTGDLYEVTKKNLEGSTPEFKKKCRLAITQSLGKIVAFPNE